MVIGMSDGQQKFSKINELEILVVVGALTGNQDSKRIGCLTLWNRCLIENGKAQEYDCKWKTVI